MIFNINFFLFSFASSNIWSYLFVYAKYYASVTNAQFGVLAMILPTLGFFAKPIACSMADAHSIHKKVLIGAYCIFGLSYGSLGIIPFFKDPHDHDNDTIAWVIMSILMSFGYVSSACAFCMNDALASNYARKHNINYGRMRVWASIGWAAGASLIILVGDVSWIPFRVLGCAILVTAISTDILFLSLWPYQEDFEMFHDGSTVDQRKLSIVGPNTLALLAQNKPRPSISRDMLERIRAGRSKSVGVLPRVEHPNLKVSLRGLGEDNNDDKKPTKIEEPKEYSNFHAQMILIKMIAQQHKSFLRYIGLFTLFGIVQGMFWTFQLDFVKLRVTKDDAEFEFISSLCMVAQSVFGEILINLVASDLIRWFGSNANLSLALVTLGLRCYFYCNLLPYLGSMSIIAAEALQGPSLGLYWVLIVDIGSNYALMVTDLMPEMRRRGIVRDRQHEEELSGCLRATMIGAMSASMEGLGVALGSFLGGILSTSFGYDAMWNICAFASISVGFINIGWDVISKLVFKRSKYSENLKQAGQTESRIEGLRVPALLVDGTQIKL